MREGNKNAWRRDSDGGGRLLSVRLCRSSCYWASHRICDSTSTRPESRMSTTPYKPGTTEMCHHCRRSCRCRGSSRTFRGFYQVRARALPQRKLNYRTSAEMRRTYVGGRRRRLKMYNLCVPLRASPLLAFAFYAADRRRYQSKLFVFSSDIHPDGGAESRILRQIIKNDLLVNKKIILIKKYFFLKNINYNLNLLIFAEYVCVLHFREHSTTRRCLRRPTDGKGALKAGHVPK